VQATQREVDNILSRIDEQLLPIESIISDPTSSREKLAVFKEHNIPEADRLLSEVRDRYIVELANEPLLQPFDRRFTNAGQQLVEMKRTIEMRLQDIDEEEHKYQQLNERLREIETVLDNLSTDEKHPQPLAEATQDRNLLGVLLEQLSTIDFTHLRNPSHRTDIEDRLTQISTRLHVCYTFCAIFIMIPFSHCIPTLTRM
jgi:DNA repair ATPase RecN